MSSSHSRAEIEQLKVKLSTLLNKQLQNICQVCGLKTSGIKADLQRRIIYALYEHSSSDPATYAHIKESINNVMAGSGRGSHHANGASSAGAFGRGAGGYSTNTNGSSHLSPSPHLQPPAFGQSGFSGYGGAQVRGGGGGYGGGASSAAVPQRPGMVPLRHSSHGNLHGLMNRPALQFKPSPFYRMEQMVGSVKTLEIMSQHRNSTTIALKTSEHHALTRCVLDKTLRIMVFCAGDDRGSQDISFPHQSELKVNGGEIKANLRGLKGKAGSTRPVDITDSLRLDKSSYTNNIEFTYALTTKVKKNQNSQLPQKFYFAIFVCELIPVNELVARIKGKKIPKASVLKELTKAANDPDVVATSQVLSLKCPLTYGRLKNPCRSTMCSHIQCFDVTSYLYLQEQGPQWVCPICNHSATFENLAIDEYVKDILDRTHEDTDQVTIEPDGKWRTEAPAEPEPKRARVSAAHSMSSIKVDDDDDIVALDDFSPPSRRTTQTPNRSTLGTPAANGSSSTPSGTRKRTAEVIDLTLSSDDEDDAPIRPPPKRQNTTVPSVPDWTFPAPFHN
ncbi:MIZ/SP-RING zinc finger [Seiridium cupressi]